jgi:hypothetical protein
VFAPGCTQQSVFEAVQPLCVSVLDGYNVSIFAYGQVRLPLPPLATRTPLAILLPSYFHPFTHPFSRSSFHFPLTRLSFTFLLPPHPTPPHPTPQTGSGKTFTIEGTPTDRGVSPRAVAELFRIVDSPDMSDWTYSVSLSMLEIYNETIRDLLDANGKPPSGAANSGAMGKVSTKEKAATLDVRQTSEGNVVPGLTEVAVNEAEQVTLSSLYLSSTAISVVSVVL